MSVRSQDSVDASQSRGRSIFVCQARICESRRRNLPWSNSHAGSIEVRTLMQAQEKAATGRRMILHIRSQDHPRYPLTESERPIARSVVSMILVKIM